MARLEVLRISLIRFLFMINFGREFFSQRIAYLLCEILTIFCTLSRQVLPLFSLLLLATIVPGNIGGKILEIQSKTSSDHDAGIGRILRLKIAIILLQE